MDLHQAKLKLLRIKPEAIVSSFPLHNSLISYESIYKLLILNTHVNYNHSLFGF